MVAKSFAPIIAGSGGVLTEQLDSLPESGSMPLIVNAAGKYVLPGGTAGTGRALIYGADGSVAWSAGPVALESALPTRATLGLAETDSPTFGPVVVAKELISSPWSVNGFRLQSNTFTGKHGLFSRYASASEGWCLFAGGVGSIAATINWVGPFVNQHIGFASGATNSTNPDTQIKRVSAGNVGIYAMDGVTPGGLTAGAGTFLGVSASAGVSVDDLSTSSKCVLLSSGLRVRSSGSMGFSSVDNNIYFAGVIDTRLKRDATGPTLRVEAEGGLKVRNLANTADAPITAGAATFSGQAASQGVIISDNPAASAGSGGLGELRLFSGAGTSWVSRINPSVVDLNSAQVINWHSSGVLGTADTKLGRGATGPTVDARAAGGFRSRNLANTADAPITASTGTFSGEIQSSNGKMLLSPTTATASGGPVYLFDTIDNQNVGSHYIASFRANGSNVLNIGTGGLTCFKSLTTSDKITVNRNNSSTAIRVVNTIGPSITMGGESASNVGLKDSGITLQVVLGDGSGLAPIQAGQGTFGEKISVFPVASNPTLSGAVFYNSVTGGDQYLQIGMNANTAHITSGANSGATKKLALNAPFIGITDESTGPSLTNASGALAVRNATNTADAPITASTGTFSGSATTPQLSHPSLLTVGCSASGLANVTQYGPSGVTHYGPHSFISKITTNEGTTFRGGPDDPTTSDIPAGTSTVWNNTTTSELKLWANVSGTLKSVLLS